MISLEPLVGLFKFKFASAFVSDHKHYIRNEIPSLDILKIMDYDLAFRSVAVHCSPNEWLGPSSFSVSLNRAAKPLLLPFSSPLLE